MVQNQYYVYILANKKHGTLYVGFTTHLIKRIWEHKSNLVSGFTQKYQIHKLVYYEIFLDLENALLRERRIKTWKRVWKIQLIEKSNPQWRDLYDEIAG